MSSVWLTIPSARPPVEANPVLERWRAMGYEIALCCDSAEDAAAKIGDHFVAGTYAGYAHAVNRLVLEALALDAHASWFVIGGDDVFPDPTKRADEIAAECEAYFASTPPVAASVPRESRPSFGVMQPTGDRWGENEIHLGKRGSAYLDRVCGSAWIGREFATRVNRGNGPLWPEYWHMGVDEELQAVATRLGVLWQRPELTQHHEHWARKRGRASDMPKFLERANSSEEWARYKELYAQREAAGFPGSEPK